MSIRSISSIESAVVPSNAASQSAQPHDGAEVPAIPQPTDSITTNALVVAVINRQGQGLRFSVDEESGTRIIKVVDLKSGDVVRQIPSEDVVNFLRQSERHKGFLLSISS